MAMHLQHRLRFAVSMTPNAILFVLLGAAWIIPLLLLFARAIPTCLLVIAGRLAIYFPIIILLILIVLHITGQIQIVVGSSMAIGLQVSDNSRTNLDLNLGLKATDGDRETKPRDIDQDEGSNRPKEISSGMDIKMKTTINSKAPNRSKGIASTTDLKMRV